ncbi:Ig-like domain-containing protein [Nitratireductor basaltis]|uniref:Serine-aspartate repeat-containing protein D n=1 Tax=Nitratireductor basaltis TaxID=472175 RepID=A0A084U5E9_9HYPH|nr:Ig-like domain-containing protein [Nitratireductor basaltis]KFB08185.1 Serine-aspartate repeat-containing protein D precursor [Nitratireductor basaltis]
MIRVEIQSAAGNTVRELTSARSALKVATADRIALGVQIDSVAQYLRDGNDLVITLVDGRQVILQDYFLDDANGIPELFLADTNANGELVYVEVTFSEAADGTLVASYGAGAAAGGLGFLPIALLGGLAAAGIAAAASGSDGDGNGGPGDGDNGDGDNGGGGKPEQPELIKKGITEFTGTAQPGYKVIAENDDGEELGTAIADDDGNWVIPFDPPLPPDENVTIIVEGPTGETSDPITVPADGTPPDAPEVDEHNGDRVTGTTEPGATVIARDSNGTPVGSAIADEDGNYVIDFDPPLRDGTEVEVTATDTNGNESDPTPVIIDANPPGAPDYISYNPDLISGEIGDDDAKEVEITLPDGTKVTVPVEDGKFEYEPNPPLNDGDVVDVEVIDNAGNRSPADELVIDGIAPDTPVLTKQSGTEVAGEAEPGSTVTVRDQNGNVLGSAVADENGNFTVPLSPQPPHGTPISVVAEDDAGNVSDPANGTIDAMAPDAPILEQQNGSQVTGEAEAGATVTVRDQNGNVLGSAVADENGNFVVELSPKPAHGTPISVVAEDSNGNVSDPANGVIDAMAPDNPVVEKHNANEVTGTAEPGSTVTVRDGNGNVLGTAIADPSTGEYAVELSPPAANGTRIEVTATDTNGNESDPTNGVIDAVAPEQPNVTAYNASEIAGDGAEAGTIITATDSMGTVVGSATVNPDGTYSITPTRPLADGETIDLTLEDAAGNVSVPKEVVIDAIAPDQPDLTAYNGNEVSGTVEAGATVEMFDENGNLVGTAQLGPDQTEFSFTGNFQDNQKVYLRVTDAAGNSSEDLEVIIDDIPIGPPTAVASAFAAEELAEEATSETEMMSRAALTENTEDNDGFATLSNDIQRDDFQIPEPLSLLETYNSGRISGHALEGNDPDRPEADATIYIYDPDMPGFDADNLDPSEAIASATTDENGFYEMIFEGADRLPHGKTLFGNAVDKAGNETKFGFIVDDAAPEFEVLTNYPYELTFESEPGSDVELRDETGQLLGTATVGSDGLYRFEFPNEVEAGKEFTLVARDKAGNFSETDVSIIDAPLNHYVPPVMGTRTVRKIVETFKKGTWHSHGKNSFLLLGDHHHYANVTETYVKEPAKHTHEPVPYEGEAESVVALDDNGSPINPPIDSPAIAPDAFDLASFDNEIEQVIEADIASETESLVEAAEAEAEALELDAAEDDQLEIIDEVDGEVVEAEGASDADASEETPENAAEPDSAEVEIDDLEIETSGSASDSMQWIETQKNDLS